ncbi:MAG: iron chelate uptake ABC transporter family permease subunit [Gemmatimonadales bacterium]|nr:iron chelate uptake ABC transporter family permease subunit [Gemmatimonadales bacterium]NIN12821.1 iron chelate uptake ABC transporter family permease subunit [Gemmatimonadales bacterium]NIN48749.1 iron chelate uptake ABC transporter family permease subunit [Gemmatimonadales bacterium]NIP06213.1 iron chelate uptake ABC transporter family permease subunit [Gemmatimonadales bacterium]NIR01398.1 iron chelate uptake ABC transporter family permease subunit [Gemmatimonadales bacterium]
MGPLSRWLVLGATAAVVALAALAVGPAELSLVEVWRALLGTGDVTAVAIIRDLRLPRVLLAFLIGGSLSVTGATLQALVRNPLADPYLLGLSGGAGLGAVAAIVLHVGGAWGVPAAALVGALLAIALVYRIAVVTGSVLDARVLLLGGVVVGSFAAAVMGAIMAVSPAPEVHSAVLWWLGSFDRASWQSLGIFGAYAVIPLGVLYSMARPLDLLALGEESARFLGADVERLKRVLYFVASVLTAAAVSISGIIGFVGLVIPHAIRILWGHTHQALLPGAFLLGGALMVLADAVARTAFAPLELPVGVVTALIGVPVFIVLVRRWAR